MSDKRTRTPRPHVFRVTAGDTLDGVESYVEAHTIVQAKAWFVDNRLRIEEVGPREIHEAGQDGMVLYSAIGDPLDAGAQDEPELFDTGTAGSQAEDD
jgi:hypothetical protein